MLNILPEVLDSQQLATVRQILDEGRFASGKASAGAHACRQKENEELVDTDAQMSRLNNLLMGALIQHPVYLNAGLPYRIAVPYYARYRRGMRYGPHVDDPVMGGPDPRARYRCDVAITVYLSGADEYAGGELVIQTDFGEQQVKRPAGDGVMYPASSVHEVLPVTEGERLVAVTWMQSMVPTPGHRDLLYQLWLAREEMRQSAPEADSTRRIDQSYVNLIRMWTQV